MHRTKSTLDAAIYTASIGLPEARLSDSIGLIGQTTKAHWDVISPAIIALHQLFDDLRSDKVVGCLVSLSSQAYGSVRSAARPTQAGYPVKASTGPDHFAASCSAFAECGDKGRSAIENSAKIGVQDTSDPFAEVSRAVDKALWFIKAHRG